jgi:hypothetical protein
MRRSTFAQMSASRCMKRANRHRYGDAMPSKPSAIVVSVLVIAVVSAGVLFFYDPAVSVHLKNDSNKLLELSCEARDVIARPDSEVVIPVSWGQPEPCFVTVGKDENNHAGPYGGCVFVNPLLDHFTLLSQATHHWSIARCSALGSR